VLREEPAQAGSFRVTLFRPESLHSRQQAWLGSIHVVQPVGLRWLTFGVLVTVIATSTLLFRGEYTRKAHLTGVLVPDRGLIRIVPAVAGAVLSVAVREGQSVRQGEVLAILRVDAPSLNGGSQRELQLSFDQRTHSLDEAARQAAVLKTTRDQSLVLRITALQREIEQVNTQAALHQQRLALAEQALARLESLRGDQFVSAAQVQAKAEDVLGMQADGAAIARQRQTLQRELATLEADRREVPLQTAQRLGEIERDRAEIAEAAARADAQAAERQLVVRAPADGVVSALLASVGQTLSADAALASLMPAGAQLQAQLYAPSSALGFIQVAQPVWLRVQAFPYQQFGLQPGQVQQVALAPLQAVELASVPMAQRVAGSEPLYRVTVRLERQLVQAGGVPRPLLAGMQLEADVMLEKRRLIDWLFEPVRGWSRRV
jgi:membrane fusion protein